MKLYLSSYKFGNNPERFPALFGNNKKVTLISNSLDFSNDLERLKQSELDQLEGLKNLGLKPEVLDLRNYFGKKTELATKLEEFAGVWVRGGNTFVLRAAYKLCGFDDIIQNYARTKPDFVYGGYSAGVCVLQESLAGLELVDDPNLVKPTYGVETDYSGIGIIDFIFVPHYKSDHPESAMVDTEVEYYQKNKIAYRTFHDGEVEISET